MDLRRLVPSVVAVSPHNTTRKEHGYGQSVWTTERRVQFFERCGVIHQESTAAYQAWRRILVLHAIQGVAVHDARLVALMETAGIAHIVTLNAKDFARYPGIVAISPKDIAASAKHSP